MNKWIAAAVGAGVALSVAFVVPPPEIVNAKSRSDTYRQLDQLMAVFEQIRSEYVEEVDDAEVIEAAINGMLSSLDPHSSYLNADRFRSMQVQTSGEFSGLGLEVSMENGLVKVIAPIEGTPADRAGIKGGDLISEIDGQQVLGMTLQDAITLMRGPIKSSIDIKVIREGAEAPLPFTVVRDTITVRSVRSRAEGDVGYVRISTFNKQTSTGLYKAVEKLKKEIGDSMSGIVLDLRGNPGGLLDQAISVSDAFLERGEIVSTRSRDPRDIQRYNARSGDIVDGLPVIVLINAYSASASEIVAGALQDHRRGIILGDRSFGKGTVQTIIPIGSEAAMRLTTARYYTPSGRSIQESGISPDIEVEQVQIAENSAPRRVRREADLPGHFVNENGDEDEPIPEAEPEADEKDTPADDDGGTKGARPIAQSGDEPQDYQLNYALDLLKSIALYNERFAMSQ
ncbi:MAG: S41 family peptidase [Pseudomonadota bacterium]